MPEGWDPTILLLALYGVANSVLLLGGGILVWLYADRTIREIRASKATHT